MSNNEQTIISFDFKYVKTGETDTVTVDIEATMSVFIYNIRRCLGPYAQTDNHDNLYIIEAGQFNNINGRDAELAPAIEPSDIKIKDYFNKRLKTTSFYVR